MVRHGEFEFEANFQVHNFQVATLERSEKILSRYIPVLDKSHVIIIWLWQMSNFMSQKSGNNAILKDNPLFY